MQLHLDFSVPPFTPIFREGKIVETGGRWKQPVDVDMCPEEPVILSESKGSKVELKGKGDLSRTRVNALRQIPYQPKILTNSKSLAGTYTSWYEASEHSRQLLSLKDRIQNCKSFQQRKKDHNDPILYPTYFMRYQKRAKDARIDGYYRRVIARQNFPPVRAARRPLALQSKPIYPTKTISPLPTELVQSELPSPARMKKDLSKQKSREQSKNEKFIMIPRCNRKDIALFVDDQRIFRGKDLKVLRARMGHYYGERVELQWGAAMNVLGLQNADKY